jgi:hypothetical protein
MNITDLYSTRIQKNFDEDQAEIISILKANPKKLVKLINFYKGLPLSYPATIVAVDRGAVDLDVQAEQAFAIENNRISFIRSSLFKHDVLAHLQYVNIKKKAATFVKFSYVEVMAERRNFIRMLPEPLPHAVIESPLGTIEGTICDVSLSGLSISIDQSVPLEKDMETSIQFMLCNIDQSICFDVSVPGRLVAITGEKLPRSYIFSINPEKLLERQLSQYIFQRQIEIIGEIKGAVL